MCLCWTCRALPGSSGAESTVPLARALQGNAGGTQIPICMETGFWQPCLSTCAPFPPLCDGAGAKGKLLVMLTAAWMLMATPQHPPWQFCWHLPKPLKGKLYSFFLYFLSSCPRVLLLLCVELPGCPEEAEWVWGCGSVWELFLSNWFMSKRNNNNKTFGGKQGNWEVQLLLRPDLRFMVLPERV